MYTPEDLVALSKLRQYSVISKRLEIVVQFMEGDTQVDIAENLRISLSSVKKWSRRYRENGIEGLCDLPRSGQPRRLSDEQERELCEMAIKPGNEFRSCNDLRKLVYEKYGLEICVSTVEGILKRHKVTKIQPRPFHAKKNK